MFGAVVLAELRCAACHAGLAAEAPPGPDLDEVGARVDPDHLRRFLASPAEAQPGTKMPALLAHLAPDARDEAATALTHFLVGGAPRGFARSPLDPGEVAAGRELFHSVGCVACHGPLAAAPLVTGEDDDAAEDEEGEKDEEEEEEATDEDLEAATSDKGSASAPDLTLPEGLVPLGHVPTKYSHGSLAEFLFQPLHVRAAGRMPDLLLSSVEARAIAAYVLDAAGVAAAADPVAAAPFVVDTTLAARGAALFEALRCAACHVRAGTLAPARLGPRALRLGGGCVPAEGAGLDGVTRSVTPRYVLSGVTYAALATALAPVGPDTLDSDPSVVAERTVAESLEAFQCLVCHSRGDLGGVPRALSAHFRTTQPDLGEEARIPPQLTLVGAKLQGDWLRKVLFDGARVRPYMTTRMPQFGETNLAALPAAFAELEADALTPYTMPVPEGDAANAAKQGGRDLLGVTGLACVTCHDFNGTPSPGFRGLDLITTPERLRPAWFARFAIAPQSLRPGIIMPESWPGGVAVHQGILGGDTDAQLRAIWYFLTQGRTADDPEGIRPKPTFLTVEGPARVYRGRSDIAGFRGFAVGSAAGLHYAFNAETGALTGLWRGDFVSVRWDGQGAGEFHPRGDAARLAQDLAVASLASSEAPWPTRAKRTKEAPVNPAPEYPRDHGYRFHGYRVDAASVPTFSYSSGDVRIDDRSVVESAESTGRGERLRRTLTFTAPAPSTRYVRVLTGEVTAIDASTFAVDRVTVSLPAGANIVQRPGPPQEVLLRLDLPAGTSSTTIDYELRR